jgi:V/A-type H+-transporting ATPase subunit E
MPNTIEDKISLFTKVIIERIELDCKQKQSKLVDYYEKKKRDIINDYEERKRIAIEQANKDAETKKRQLILKTRSEMHLSLLKKRQEFTERITDVVRKKTISFLNTDEYTKFLIEAIKQSLVTFANNQFIIFNFSKNDFEKKYEIIIKSIGSSRSKDSYKIDTIEDIIGGVYVKSGDGRMEIDFTINTILEDSDKLIGKVLSSRLNKEQYR